MSQSGCAFHILNVSTFMNSKFEENLENNLNVTVTLTEEGTGESDLFTTELRAKANCSFLT